MGKNLYINNESGIALVIALVMLLALTVIGISSVTTSTLDIQLSGNERRAAKALHLADSGIETAFLDLMADFDFDKNWANNSFTTRSTGATVTDNAFFNGQPYGEFSAGPPDGQWGNFFAGGDITGAGIGNATDLYGVQELGAGTGNFYRVLMIRDSDEPEEIYVRSYAVSATGAQKIIQLYLNVKKVDAWENAIFAGEGSGTDVIRGNITVAGSVHILGTGASEVVFAVSGNAKMINGYDGLPPQLYDGVSLKGRIPSEYIRTEYVNGQLVETLESTLRVKNGAVEISGSSANVGEAGDQEPGISLDDSSALYKSKLDAIYLNDGVVYGGGATSAQLQADEKNLEGGYDLGDKLMKPDLSDPYDGQTDRAGNPLNPVTECAVPNNCTYRDFIETKSIAMPVCELKAVQCGGGCTPTAAFSVGSHDPVTGDCTDPLGCVDWDPGETGVNTRPASLNIEGNARFDDSCAVTENHVGSAGTDVFYTGKGILYSKASVTVDGNLVTDTADNAKFVKDHLLAVLASNNVTFSKGLDATGVFYAGGDFISGSTSTIVGSIMADSFNLGAGAILNKIYYVDQIPEKLDEMGMLSSPKIYSFKKYAWKEVF